MIIYPPDYVAPETQEVDLVALKNQVKDIWASMLTVPRHLREYIVVAKQTAKANGLCVSAKVIKPAFLAWYENQINP